MDPKKILDMFKELYGAPSAGTHFNAIKTFLSSRWGIPSFITHVHDAQHTLTNSRPSEHSVNDFDSELLTSVLIRRMAAY